MGWVTMRCRTSDVIQIDNVFRWNGTIGTNSTTRRFDIRVLSEQPLVGYIGCHSPEQRYSALTFFTPTELDRRWRTKIHPNIATA